MAEIYRSPPGQPAGWRVPLWLVAAVCVIAFLVALAIWTEG